MILGTSPDKEIYRSFPEFGISFNERPFLIKGLFIEFVLSVFNGLEESWALDGYSESFHFLNSIKRF